jgi:hypothetical protein
MFAHDRARPRHDRRFLGRAASVFALVVAAVLATGCEDKQLGRPCSDIPDASPLQGAYTTMASDCPSRICNKPGVQPGVSTDLDTGPYCTIPCATDDDCNGETRDVSNKLDTRCKRGYVCSMPFDVGELCCKKLCLCRDFVSASTGPLVPEICANDPKSCNK